MKAETLERLIVIILSCDIFTISRGCGRFHIYMILRTISPGFNNGATQLMFIYFIENLLGNVVISYLKKCSERIPSQVKVMINIFFVEFHSSSFLKSI